MADAPLPSAYLDYLRRIGGGEGDLDVAPGWIQFWPAERVVELNDAYEISRNLPGFFGFATSGGGELLAFDMREAGSPPVVMVPFISMDPEEAQTVAATFDALLLHLPAEAKAEAAG